MCLHCHRFRWKTFSGGSLLDTERSSAAGVRSAGVQCNWKVPHRILVKKQDSTDRREAKVFRAHAARQGVCDNLINALRLLANQQKDGDSPVEMVVLDFQEKSRLTKVGKKSAQYNGRAQNVHHGRQPSSGGDLGRHGVVESGEAEFHDRFS